jgi:hypothetical protein
MDYLVRTYTLVHMSTLNHGFKRVEEVDFSDATAVRLAQIGMGNIADYHLVYRHHPGFRLTAVADLNTGVFDAHQRLLDIPNRYASLEELLDRHAKETQVLVLSVPSGQKMKLVRQALQRGVGVFVEKPAATSAVEFKEILDLDKERRLIIEGAHHAAFNNSVLWMVNQLSTQPDGTIRHSEYGQLTKVILEKYDPYVIDGSVPHAPENSSGQDTWPNILTELGAYTGNEYEVTDATYIDTSIPGHAEVKAEVRGTFPGGTFAGFTDWTRTAYLKGYSSEKNTTLLFEDGTAIRMELVPREVFRIRNYAGNKNDVLEPMVDFNGDVGRMRREYWEMYVRLEKVARGVLSDNRELILKYLTAMDKAKEIAEAKLVKT